MSRAYTSSSTNRLSGISPKPFIVGERASRCENSPGLLLRIHSTTVVLAELFRRNSDADTCMWSHGRTFGKLQTVTLVRAYIGSTKLLPRRQQTPSNLVYSGPRSAVSTRLWNSNLVATVCMRQSFYTSIMTPSCTGCTSCANELASSAIATVF